MQTDRVHEAWVLLRGLGREAAHWEDFPEQLQSALGGATVQAVDLPGTGVRCAVPSPLTIAEIMEATRSTLAVPSNGNASVRFVLGISLGGMVALEWAARYPGEVAGVVIINCSAGGICKPWQRLRPRAWWPLLQAVICTDVVTRERRVLQLTSHVDPDNRCLHRRAQIFLSRPLRLHNLLRQLIAAVLFKVPLLPARTPILVLAGAGDRLVNPACAQALQNALGAELRMHPTANHDLPLDDAAWTVARIAEWRDGLETGIRVSQAGS